MESQPAYNSSRQKLVLAFDVGTRYSGILYSVLDPGRVPEIKGVSVTRFPVHEHVNGASKIPTIVYYDQSGKVRAMGAEAASEVISAQAEEEKWVKAKWFKLHLRSKVGTRARKVGNDIPPLPLNKTVVEVFADFLAYLFECASSYIQEMHTNGAEFWVSVKDHIEFVLLHPNGWEGTQQAELRKAAVLAKLIPNTLTGHEQLSFVTEGEASLHFAIENGLPDRAMKNGDRVVIVDAGGGTIDISSYSRDMSTSLSAFEEVAAPQCHFHGSVFVNICAQKFLKKYLAGSPYVDNIDHIVHCFDKTTKLWFKDVEVAQYVKFGSARENDAFYNIHFGQLKLLGPDVASFFKPSINCIVKPVMAQGQTTHKTISHVVLVGGFAASNYVFNTVHAALKSAGLSVLHPENHVNKAVSNGSISFYLDHFVRSRISKVIYGLSCTKFYNPTNVAHLACTSSAYILAESGYKKIPEVFSIILGKNTQISETKEFRKSYITKRTLEYNFLSGISLELWCYWGLIADPKWKDIDPDNYTKLCLIDLPILSLPKEKCQKHRAQAGTFYHQIPYDVVLLFGLAELKAQIAWNEGGIEKRSVAQIFYNSNAA